MVGVGIERALGDVDIFLWDNLIQGVGPSRENFARITMAEDMSSVFQLDLPFGLTAVALSVIHRHDES